jgi:hypothetical protein
MKSRFTEHPIWNHDLFKDPEYISFASQLLQVMEQTEVPEILRVERRNPDIAALHQDLSTKLDQ